MTSKKTTPKKQEPPTEQQPAPAGSATEDSAPDGTVTIAIGAPEPSQKDRIAALELANIDLEKRILQLERNCKASHGMR